MSVVVTTLCDQPEAFASDLGDDQSRYLIVAYYPVGPTASLHSQFPLNLSVSRRGRKEGEKGTVVA